MRKPVTLNRLDKAVAWFSPVRAARRVAARQFMDMQAQHYQGARSSRITANWATGQTSADAALDSGRQILVNRSRDLNRNNPIASGITNTLVTNAIHTGLKPQSRVDFEAIGITSKQAELYQKQAEKVYARWEPFASATGRLYFRELQTLAARQIAESGEFLAVRRAIDSTMRPYFLALDVIEPDRLADPARSRADVKQRYGITFNQHGAPIKYNIRKTHPGENIFRGERDPFKYKQVNTFDRNGRRQVFHIFPMLRPGQTRGVPFLTPVIEQFKILADYIDVTLIAARVSACFVAFVSTHNPYDVAVGISDDTDAEGTRLESLQPGLIDYIGKNKKVDFAKPEQPTTTFDSFVERFVRMIGASLGLPYELTFKDFSKTNYSSAKAALEQSYRVFIEWQQMIRLHLCVPVWELLMEEAWLRGELTAPGFMNPRMKWEYTRSVWIAAGWQSIDPKKQAEADKLDLANRTTNRAKINARTGEDWEQNVEQLGREQKKIAEQGLKEETQPNPNPQPPEQDVDDDEKE